MILSLQYLYSDKVVYAIACSLSYQSLIDARSVFSKVTAMKALVKYGVLAAVLATLLQTFSCSLAFGVTLVLWYLLGGKRTLYLTYHTLERDGRYVVFVAYSAAVFAGLSSYGYLDAANLIREHVVRVCRMCTLLTSKNPFDLQHFFSK